MESSARPVLLLGSRYERYGRVALCPVSPHTACAISAGADEEFAKTTQKRHVNEDGALVIEDERHTVACVADAHFGREASEELLVLLARELTPVPPTPDDLAARMERVAGYRPSGGHGSETTLAILILDRLFRQAFGISYGDSSVVLARRGEVPQRENEKTSGFVTLARPETLLPAEGRTFSFSPHAGDLVLVHTDGIDECCYRDPDRSITPEVMHGLLERSGRDPRRVATALAELALRGVDGRPGGQDNLALVVTRA